jgi:molecular chaperone GrpE
MSEDQPAVAEKTDEKEEAASAKDAPDVEILQKEKDELLMRMKYLQADFENYKKRSAREAEAFRTYAQEDLLVRLLPVLDEFDVALARLDGSSAEGVRMVRDDLMKALREVGLVEIPAEDQPFDPYVHDCVEQVVDPNGDDGHVKEVVAKGYRMRDRVLRPAQVIVIKNSNQAQGEKHG